MNQSDTDKILDKATIYRLLHYFTESKTVLVIVLLGTVFIGLADSAFGVAGKLLMDLFAGITQATSTGSPLEMNFSYSRWGHTLYDFSIDGSDQAGQMLIIIALSVLGLTMIKGSVHFVKEYLLYRITNRILMRLKRELFHQVVRLPLSYFDKGKSGDVLSRITYDVSQIEGAIRAAINVAKCLIVSVIYVSILFIMEWKLALFALMIFPLSAVIIKRFGDKMRKVSRNISLNVADYTSLFNEALNGIKVIKAFGREKDKQTTFENKISANYRFSMKIAKYATLNAPIQEFVSTIGTSGIIIFCGYRMISGAMTIGDLSAFIILLTLAYKPIKTLGETNAVVQKAITSGRRIFELIDQPDEAVVIGSGSHKPNQTRGQVTYKNVSFSYDDENPALQDVNLDIHAGETVAFVGPSGGGKSTLVSLLPRFYRLQKGSIELDGTDIAEYDIAYLRNQIAVVPQETILFSGTIAENIRLGDPNATDSELIEAAKSANADHFIKHLPEGYKAQVGERGAQLSGGQRQRIALARAILRDPRILILDEATSALDSESERLIQDALDKFRQNRTTLIIAHRLSTVQSADRIAVMSEGKLVEIGSHQQLIEQDGVYRRLHEQQFSV